MATQIQKEQHSVAHEKAEKPVLSLQPVASDEQRSYVAEAPTLQGKNGAIGAATVDPELLGAKPVELVCPVCSQTVVTKTTRKLNATGWNQVSIFVYFFLIFAWIPCVIDSNYKTKHSCPNCNAKLGKYNDK